MALIVRLIDDIKTETVIKLITVRRIRVMAGPDRIDVVLFHYLQIFFDLCKADCKSRHRIAVVAVCSVEFDLHAVQVQHTVLRVDLTDADMIRDHLTRRLQHQRIQIRLLGIPQTKVDYWVPFVLPADAKTVTVRVQKSLGDALCWKEMKLSDTFDPSHTDKFRPVYHHAPLYGWMNNANGLVYEDEEYVTSYMILGIFLFLFGLRIIFLYI